MWAHAVCVDFFKKESASWSDVEYFVLYFKSQLQFDEQETNILYEQFIDFQMLSTDELSVNALTDVMLHEFHDGNVEYRMDVIWYNLRQMRSPIGNGYRFHLLFRVACVVVLIPHSNAGIERVFSLVNKTRMSLQTEIE